MGFLGNSHIYEASLSDKHIGAVNVRQVTAVTKFSSIAEFLRFVFVMLIFIFLSRKEKGQRLHDPKDTCLCNYL